MFVDSEGAPRIGVTRQFGGMSAIAGVFFMISGIGLSYDQFSRYGRLSSAELAVVIGGDTTPNRCCDLKPECVPLYDKCEGRTQALCAGQADYPEDNYNDNACNRVDPGQDCYESIGVQVCLTSYPDCDWHQQSGTCIIDYDNPAYGYCRNTCSPVCPVPP
jgi:hypothetical protein